MDDGFCGVVEELREGVDFLIDCRSVPEAKLVSLRTAVWDT